MVLKKKPYFSTWSLQTQEPLPEILGGQGARFQTTDGWWLDMASLSYSANLGHGHPRMVEAIKRQADKFCLCSPNHAFEAKEELASRLLELAPPGFDKVFFTLGGSDAVENALKMARLVTGRYKTISRYRSYHGASMGALGLTGDYRRPPLEPGLTGALHALDCHCYRCPFGQEPTSCQLECATQFDHIMTLEGIGSVAAVFCEPIPGANGVLVPPKGYWKKLREACDKHGALLVADEVLTGFGRTGRWFGIEHEDVVPDMITLAKGLTGGYAPLGAVLVHERVSQRFEEQKLYCGLTYYGHPLSCAAGVEALSIYSDEGLIGKADKLSGVFTKGLTDIATETLGQSADVRSRGLLGAIEWERGTEPGWEVFFRELSAKLKAEKIHCYAKADTGMLILAPPLVIDSEELSVGLERIRACVNWAWEKTSLEA